MTTPHLDMSWIEWSGNGQLRRLKFRDGYIEQKQEASRLRLTEGAVNALPWPVATDTVREQEAKNAKRRQAGEIIGRWQSDGGSRGVDALYRDVIAAQAQKDPALRTRSWQNLQAKLQEQLGEAFTQADAAVISSSILAQRSLYGEYAATRKLSTLARFDDGKDYRELQRVLTDSSRTEEQKAAGVEAVFQSSIDRGNTELGVFSTDNAAVLAQIHSIDVRELQEMERAVLEETLASQLAEQASRLSLEQIGLPGLRALYQLTTEGDGSLARTILAGTVRNIPTGVVGVIEGKEVEVSSTAKDGLHCSLINGERRFQLDSALTRQSFNTARISDIGKSIHSEFFEDPSTTRDRIWDALFRQREGEHFMTSEEAGLTEQCIKSLVAKCTTKQEETTVLRKLGMVLADGKPNMKFLAWWPLELHYLRQEIPAESFPSMIRPELLYPLMEKWRSENKLSLLSYGELTNLAQNPTPREMSPEHGSIA